MLKRKTQGAVKDWEFFFLSKPDITKQSNYPYCTLKEAGTMLRTAPEFSVQK